MSNGLAVYGLLLPNQYLFNWKPENNEKWNSILILKIKMSGNNNHDIIIPIETSVLNFTSELIYIPITWAQELTVENIENNQSNTSLHELTSIIYEIWCHKTLKTTHQSSQPYHKEPLEEKTLLCLAKYTKTILSLPTYDEVLTLPLIMIHQRNTIKSFKSEVVRSSLYISFHQQTNPTALYQQLHHAIKNFDPVSYTTPPTIAPTTTPTVTQSNTTTLESILYPAYIQSDPYLPTIDDNCPPIFNSPKPEINDHDFARQSIESHMTVDSLYNNITAAPSNIQHSTTTFHDDHMRASVDSLYISDSEATSAVDQTINSINTATIPIATTVHTQSSLTNNNTVILTRHLLDITIGNTFTWSQSTPSSHNIGSSAPSALGAYVIFNLPHQHPSNITDPADTADSTALEIGSEDGVNEEAVSLWWDAEYSVLNGRRKVTYEFSDDSDAADAPLLALYDRFIPEGLGGGIEVMFQYCDDDSSPLFISSNHSPASAGSSSGDERSSELSPYIFGRTLIPPSEWQRILSSKGGTFNLTLPIHSYYLDNPSHSPAATAADATTTSNAMEGQSITLTITYLIEPMSYHSAAASATNKWSVVPACPLHPHKRPRSPLRLQSSSPYALTNLSTMTDPTLSDHLSKQPRLTEAAHAASNPLSGLLDAFPSLSALINQHLDRATSPLRAPHIDGSNRPPSTVDRRMIQVSGVYNEEKSTTQLDHTLVTTDTDTRLSESRHRRQEQHMLAVNIQQIRHLIYPSFSSSSIQHGDSAVFGDSNDSSGGIGGDMRVYCSLEVSSGPFLLAAYPTVRILIILSILYYCLLLFVYCMLDTAKVDPTAHHASTAPLASYHLAYQ